MLTDEKTVLEILLRDSPLALAVQGEDGSLVFASEAFAQVTGLGAGSPPPPWLSGPRVDGTAVQLGERHFELWARELEHGRLVGLRERTEVVAMEDQLWEQQTCLSKVYSELSVRNEALTSTLEELRRREAEITALNRSLEEKVAAQLVQLERSSRLRRYLSPEVANTVLQSDATDLTTRKRLLTVFFADIASFDELTSEMESKEIIELVSDYRREMTAILFAHGGTLDKFVSARIIGFFGDPVPQEDHPARAVRAGLQVRDRVWAMRHKWFPATGSVELQVGIHTGYATVGNVGSEYRLDYTVIGKNVTLASALQQEAKPGHVLLTARTYEAVKGLFEFESLQVNLKGYSRPITAYNARSEKLPEAAMAVTLDQSGLYEREAPPADLVGKHLGPYVVMEKLGEGGMGIVYKALDARLQRTVAIKVLPSELAADPTFLARFKWEARALASLNSPYIAQIYTISDDDRPPFFAMEFVEGPTLRQVLNEQGRLPLRRSLDLLIQMARGLQEACEKGVIHRDIKPDNVMLTLKGQVKLTDFGLVKRVGGDPGMTTRGIVLGTPLYMSPEQARGEELDLRSDIYSLGATFFHMLVGEPPFRGDSALTVMRKHEEEELPPLATLPGTISASVYTILQRMMAKKREDRFESYESLIEALEGC